MKNTFFKLLFVSISFFSLLSCNEDDSNGIDEINNPLQGSWYLEKVGSINTINSENYVVYSDYNPAICGEDILTFDQNTCTYLMHYLDFDVCLEETISGTYNYSGNLIDVTSTNSDGTTFNKAFTVINLTEDQLEISYVDYFTGETVFNILGKQ